VIGDVAGVNIRISSEQVGDRVGFPDIPESCGMIMVEMRRKGFEESNVVVGRG
jgi:hypothetical protein